ncbi:hypothetical protein PUNSTDRAFT_139270 [Punctularia strigosozonata HHB-11173 SS5]|uniref:Uncharacterized protein n=1 Tax=Punctularia strigosozonata (strain HHB-11173) TaxID=741275 RepID=R7S1N6_PUNST|nr:uncharacterized protein PUNSTDRAFT_139270 [Punctularia strigosozonata HHB-11173 SS5]EIN03744.1 hypothetical protein PUNSTDRAFT_139270 [Punctularia strigosozonata HHB-11173 SS5]
MVQDCGGGMSLVIIEVEAVEHGTPSRVVQGIREMEHDKQQAAAAGKTGKTEIDVLADMKRWMLSHSEMFDFVICQALKVDIVKPLDRPDQCILIDVDYAPPDARGRLPKRQQQFIIKKCTVCDAPPEYRYWEFSEPGLADLHRLSEEIKANGGVGVNIVSLRCLSKEARFAQPIIIKDRPLAQRRLWVENWEELFRKVTAGEISEQSVNELWTKLKLYYLVDDDSKYAVARLGPGCVMGTHKSFMDPEYERPFALQIRGE